MFNRKGEFTEEYRMQALFYVAQAYGLEVFYEKDFPLCSFIVRIYEKLPNRRILLCETNKCYLHEVNSWTQQQLNDYSTWR